MAGNNNATNTPMMAITTNSSTRVKPRAFTLVTICHLLGVRKPMKKMMQRLFHGWGALQMQGPPIDAM
jgi:hypothetical protein